VTSHQRRRLRGACKTNAERTHCTHGHKFDHQNTYWWQGDARAYPRRLCRACNRLRQRARKRPPSASDTANRTTPGVVGHG